MQAVFGCFKYLYLIIKVQKFCMKVDEPAVLFIHRTAVAPSCLSVQSTDEFSVHFYFILCFTKKSSQTVIDAYN